MAAMSQQGASCHFCAWIDAGRCNCWCWMALHGWRDTSRWEGNEGRITKQTCFPKLTETHENIRKTSLALPGFFGRRRGVRHGCQKAPQTEATGTLSSQPEFLKANQLLNCQEVPHSCGSPTVPVASLSNVCTTIHW